MYNERQIQILTQITQGLDLPADMARTQQRYLVTSCQLLQVTA
jgi:hypothetical protein